MQPKQLSAHKGYTQYPGFQQKKVFNIHIVLISRNQE